jgi:SAM-dependent methyltransferase
VLGLRFDATGALRAYNLRRIPRDLFAVVGARGYGFFFESMFVLVRRGHSVAEFSIVLPARTYGTSKMTVRETLRSGFQLLSLRLRSLAHPSLYKPRPIVNDASNGPCDVSADVRSGVATAEPVDPQGWDSYWDSKTEVQTKAYDLIASAYRRSFIRTQLERFIFRNFGDGSHLLHAGSGSGQVDVGLHARMKVTAVDISQSAIRVYRANNPAAFDVRRADILRLPFPASTFDGAYNLGVMEHFSTDQIVQILTELNRVIKPGGRVVVLWPHARATSVAVLRGVHWLFNDLLNVPTRLHPAEPSLLQSKSWVEPLFRKAGFTLSTYSFGPRDLFVQAVLVGQKQ